LSLCDVYLTDITTAYGESAYWLGLADTNVTWLKSNYSTSAFNLNWRTAVALSIARIDEAVRNLTYGNWSYNTPYRIPYYLANCIEAGAPPLTMDDILSIMVTAEPEQIEYFVGLVDAYRQSIWNKPFNSEFFGALARGFEQWP